MDTMAWLTTDRTLYLGLGGRQIQGQMMFSGSQIVAIEVKQMKARQQAVKQFHEQSAKGNGFNNFLLFASDHQKFGRARSHANTHLTRAR